MSDSKKPMIPGRVMLIGNEKIPREVLENLPDDHLKIFLREPDPEKWPQEMRHLAQYVSREEEIELTIADGVSRYDSILQDALERWVAAVLRDLVEDKGVPQDYYRGIFDEMGSHLGDLLMKAVAKY